MLKHFRLHTVQLPQSIYHIFNTVWILCTSMCTVGTVNTEKTASFAVSILTRSWRAFVLKTMQAGPESIYNVNGQNHEPRLLELNRI